MDFTLSAYKQLISTLQSQGYFFQTFEEYIQNPKEEKVVILCHDVDRLPGNSLKIALLENELGIRATYFFRTIPQTFKPEIIKEIAEMGHEIGYHYENLSEISRKAKGDFLWKSRMNPFGWMIRMNRMVGWKQLNMERGNTEVRGQMSEVRRARARDRDPQISQINADEEKKEFRDELFELAIDDFRLNLEKLRKLYPVKTICMHGSPLSKWDNRDLWKKYDYRDFGIIAEPYFDLDFDEVFYLTDTGRSWNNSNASIRDKVKKTEVRSRNNGMIGMNRMIPAGWDGREKIEVGGQRSEVGKGQKIRREEDEKIKERDGWMNRMIPAGWDGKDKRDEWMNRMAGWKKKGVKGHTPEKRDGWMTGWLDDGQEAEVGGLRFRHTWDIIEAVENGLLPDRVMINTHPQRWTDNPAEWTKELVWQNFKNVIKKYFYVRK